MKIIIVDDSAANLVAAKKASESFPEHQFIFFSQANEVIKALGSADAIITDLFFLDENHGDNKELGEAYGEYVARLQNDETYQKVVEEYYNWDIARAQEKFECVIGMATDGTRRVDIEQSIEWCKKKGDESGELRRYQRELKNLPPEQFPYGGAIILEAHKLGKKLCLISDIHRHAGSHRDNASSVDGMMLLLPLISEGVVSIHEATYDGEGSLKYIGNDEMYAAIGGEVLGILKERSVVWEEAIRRIMAQ